MSTPRPPHPPRAPILRVLALPDEASPAAIRAAANRLTDWLAARRAQADPAETEALRLELAELGEATDRILRERAARAAIRPDRTPSRGPAAWIVAALALLALFSAYSAGFRVTRGETGEPPALYAAPGRIFLEGELEGATLRVFDADRAEVFAEQPARGARLELDPGRYALEVARADCPDAWTRSVFVEPDSVQRFAPEVCSGHGQLVVRANTTEDRLRIDELDVGHTGDRPHRLGVGEHAIRVDKAGFRSFEARVRVLRDEVVELRADLVPLAPGESAGRPLPVAKVAPSTPPVEAASAAPGFSAGELRAELAPPSIEAPDLGLPRRGDFLMREGLPAMPDGGSTAWHDRVARDLRERFDTDHSGEIDQLAESEAIACSIWKEIERDFDRGSLGMSMAHYFGFDGSDWHPGALAVARSHRSAVYAKMQECGLAD